MEGDVVVDGMLTPFSAEPILSMAVIELEVDRDKFDFPPMKESLDDLTADVTPRPS